MMVEQPLTKAILRHSVLAEATSLFSNCKEFTFPWESNKCEIQEKERKLNLKESYVLMFDVHFNKFFVKSRAQTYCGYLLSASSVQANVGRKKETALISWRRNSYTHFTLKLTLWVKLSKFSVWFNIWTGRDNTITRLWWTIKIP